MYRFIADFCVFLSTPSARRATPKAKDGDRLILISIHALREEGDQIQRKMHTNQPISIHALREEGDAVHIGSELCHDISIHALREEGDLLWSLQT